MIGVLGVADWLAGCPGNADACCEEWMNGGREGEAKKTKNTHTHTHTAYLL